MKSETGGDRKEYIISFRSIIFLFPCLSLSTESSGALVHIGIHLRPVCSTIAPSPTKVSQLAFFFYLFIIYLFIYLIGGIILWSRSFTPATSELARSSRAPVNSLVRDALVQGHTTDDLYEKDGYAVKWVFFNELELIFVVRTIPTPYLSPP